MFELGLNGIDGNVNLSVGIRSTIGIMTMISANGGEVTQAQVAVFRIPLSSDCSESRDERCFHLENTEWTENYCIHATQCNFILLYTNCAGGRLLMCVSVCVQNLTV